MNKNNELAKLRDVFEKWEKEHSEEFSHERKRQFSSGDEIPIKRVYTPLELEEKGFDYLKDLGFPGEYPYTRGISPTMYRGQLWGISHYSGYPTPELSNQLWKRQIAGGGNLAYIAYDLATQLGYDPDHPKAEGEVGRVGVSMSSLRDWEIAFDGIDISRITISQVLNGPAIIGIASHLALAQQRGIDFKELKGVCQNEILKEYYARGNYIFPPEPALRLTTDALYYCGKYVPNYQAIQVSSYHPAERGANPIHEAAFALADAFAHIQSATDRGMDVDTIAPTIQFLTGHQHVGFFQEIAKLRAMRKIYARVLKERFRAQNPESMKARWYSAIMGTSLHREQYLNNIGRITLSALVGALAGCQVIDSRAYDEAFGIPTDEAIIQSIRCQHVVAQETGVTDTVDPLAGSYFVEWLTSEYEERIDKEVKIIDEMGGMVKAIERGYVQRVAAGDAYKWQKKFESKEIVRVGVNYLPSEVEERPPRIYRADPKVEAERIAAIKELKRNRDNQTVKATLERVTEVARMEPTPDNNLMLPVLEAVNSYATVGEICGALREVWGEYVEPLIL